MVHSRDVELDSGSRYLPETLIRLTSTVAQITISHMFHVKSADLSSNTFAATISLIAAAQMLWLLTICTSYQEGIVHLQESKGEHDHNTSLLQPRQLQMSNLPHG